MKCLDWLPLGLLLALGASFFGSACIGWVLLQHGGFVVHDPLIVPRMSFGQYLISRVFVWDAQWYDAIARVGYVWHPSVTERQSLAFFPLWGLVIRPVYWVFRDHQQLWVMALIVLVAFASIALFLRLGRRLVGDRAAAAATMLYAFFPAAHFLLQSYPTALMNLIVLGVLHEMLAGRRWRPAWLAGIGSAAGPLMMVPGLTLWLVALWDQRHRLRQISGIFSLFALGLIAIGGLLGFLAWQGFALHNPLAFLMAQTPWDQPRGLAARALRFTWMLLILPDIYHIGRLTADFVGMMRSGAYDPAFIRYEFAVNFLFMTLLMVGLFWTIAVKPRFILLYGALAVLFYLWFHGSTHNGLSTMRLLYICVPGFWGLGRALQREPVWAWGAIGLSVVTLVVQEVYSDIGELVL